GAVLLVVAQLELGASWRIGIEQGARPGLVTSGVYRFCRNPIFFAILIVLTGYTLLLPTRLSLVLLVSAFVGMRLQVLTEEAYLSKAYGATYREYARGVGRFLPGIGRLRWPSSAARRSPDARSALTLRRGSANDRRPDERINAGHVARGRPPAPIGRPRGEWRRRRDLRPPRRRPVRLRRRERHRPALEGPPRPDGHLPRRLGE